MSGQYFKQDDLQPSDPERWLMEFDHWWSIRPSMKPGASSEVCSGQEIQYFGGILISDFKISLQKSVSIKKGKHEEDHFFLRRRSIIRHRISELDTPKMWMEGWSLFWTFITQESTAGMIWHQALYRDPEIWPMVEDAAVTELLKEWKTGPQNDAAAFYQRLMGLGVCAKYVVTRMRGRLDLVFKALAKKWIKDMGLSFEIHLGDGLVSTDELLPGSEEGGMTYGETARDVRAADASVEVGLTDLMREIQRAPSAFFADMTLKERAVCALQLFKVNMAKQPVIENCVELEPPRKGAELYATVQRLRDRLLQKTEQLCSDPVVSRATGQNFDDPATLLLAVGAIEKELRHHLAAWLGHPESEDVQISENAPAWFLDLLTHLKPTWKSMPTKSILKSK